MKSATAVVSQASGCRPPGSGGRLLVLSPRGQPSGIVNVVKAVMNPELIPEVRGAESLIGWFGSWPRFLDSEVLSINLNRIGASTIRIHTFEWTGELTADGHYLLQKHVVVTFVLEALMDCELGGFNHQNVINGLSISKHPDSYELTLNNVFGVGGSIQCKSIGIEFAPGKPPESQYKD
jgi:hypothetical protein